MGARYRTGRGGLLFAHSVETEAKADRRKTAVELLPLMADLLAELAAEKPSKALKVGRPGSITEDTHEPSERQIKLDRVRELAGKLRSL